MSLKAMERRNKPNLWKLEIDEAKFLTDVMHACFVVFVLFYLCLVQKI